MVKPILELKRREGNETTEEFVLNTEVDIHSVRGVGGRAKKIQFQR